MTNRIFLLCTLSAFIFLFTIDKTSAQDTLTVNLQEFLEKGLERSGQVAYQGRSVDLAKNRHNQARSQRFFPRIEFSTQHGVTPGVKSPMGFPEGQFYLDPTLENDWEDWAIFTRAELNAVQPVYSWGAISNAIKAAEAGARAAEYQFSAVKAEAETQLFELYYSYLLAIEIERILEEARSQIRQVERQLEQMQEDGDPTLKEADIFKFEIFKSEFAVQEMEVKQGVRSVESIWNHILGDNSEMVYRPAENFLDPVPFELQPFDYYQQMAVQNRPELRGADKGIEATRRGADAARAQRYPALFLGISGSYANTPNRPRQTNPFIINSTNYANAAVGFSFRQNLNFSSMRNNVERADIEHRRVQDLKDALTDGIILELNESYSEAAVAEVRVRQTNEALVTARNWVRHEQLNYDIGFGDVEDLLDAVQKELELRLKLKQNTFELNKRVAALNKAAGIPVNQFSVN